MENNIVSYLERCRAIGAIARAATLEIEISDTRLCFQHFVAKYRNRRIFALLIYLEISRSETILGVDHEMSKGTNDIPGPLFIIKPTI